MKYYPKRKKLETKFKNYEGRSTFFITMVCKSRKPILSSIVNRQVELTNFGKTADKIWGEIPERFPQVKLGEYIFMPDHFHGIIKIRPVDESENISLAQVIHWYKTISSTEYYKYGNEIGQNPIGKLWQRGYNEKWIPRGSHYTNFEKYIRENPKKFGKGRLKRPPDRDASARAG